MADNILSTVKCQELVRLEVNFQIESSSLDDLIGRTAHIQLIDCEHLIQTLINKYTHVFC
jgi:hypothetical protein